MLIFILTGIFLILHGLVHILYAGQSVHLFELRPGMNWPDEGWVLGRQSADDAMRFLVSISLGLAALGFAAGGVGLLMSRDWWQILAIGAAVLSTMIFAVFWDGKRQSLAENGGIGVLINLAILALVLIY